MTLRRLSQLVRARLVASLFDDVVFNFPLFESRVPARPYDWRKNWRNW